MLEQQPNASAYVAEAVRHRYGPEGDLPVISLPG